MFVFCYAPRCTITPPVCGSAFAAAGIAGAPWLEVALRATRIGIGPFVVPLGFVANPALLWIQSQPWLALLAAAKIGAGIWLLSRGFIRGRHSPAPMAAAVGAGAALVAFGAGA